jgi:hypothetical protein
MRPQARVDRFLSSLQRVDVGAVGGEAGRHLGTLGDGAVGGDHDVDVPGGLVQPAERRLVGALTWSSWRGSKSGISTSESMSPASRTPRSARRIAAWPTACA